MDLLFIILLFAVLFAIYDLIRKANKSIQEQTEEIKKLREDLTKSSHRK
ncbi:hypothetical protein [Sporosarcina sp. G11-34]|nr:hypothetical protein [Sporosarcina sp. G11-34]MCZ2260139.1 hypothetical protein [Sporosarcina sp. G11-34]